MGERNLCGALSLRRGREVDKRREFEGSQGNGGATIQEYKE